MSSNELIDAHQHLWVMSERPYSWIAPEYGPLYDDFTPERLEPEIAPSGVTGSVLVQAADSYEDTFYMLDVAERSNFVRGVVGWIPFDRPQEASAALKSLCINQYIKGFRNLSHDYSNPKYDSDDAWILRPKVLETIALIEGVGKSLDYVAVNDAHLMNVPTLAAQFPKLKIVVDHFGKPDIAAKRFQPWAELMTELSEYPNVYQKLSGLNTASRPDWSFEDWLPYVNHVVEVFGSQRVMLGGDWPVCILNGDYVKVWKAQVDVISHLSETDQEWIKSKTAMTFYNL